MSTTATTDTVVDARRLGVFYVENDIYALPISHAAQCVYMNLCRRCNGARECRPLISTIAADIKLSRPTVVRALAELQGLPQTRKGAPPRARVELVQVTNTGGANVYRVLPVAAAAMAPPEPSQDVTKNPRDSSPLRRKIPGSQPKNPREPTEKSQGATEGLLLEGLLLEGAVVVAASPKSRIKFVHETGEITGVVEADRERWKKLHPGIDLDHELLRAAEWLLNNPTKRRSNIAQYLANWMQRAQDDVAAGRRPVGNGNGTPRRIGGNINDAWKGRKGGDVTW